MEKIFRPSFSMAGDGSRQLFPVISSEEANDATFDSVLYNGSTPETLIPLPSDFTVGTSKSPLIAHSLFPAGFSFLNEEYPTLNHTHELCENTDYSDPRFCSVYSTGLRVPKIEPFWHEHPTADDLTQPFDFFFSKALDLTGSLPFSHLPYLHSLEQPQTEQLQLADSASRKRSRFDSVVTSSHPQTFDSFAVQNFQPGESSSRGTYNKELARKRRQNITDKLRCLQKLLPWDKKMDTATMLEEAHKYVSFLQAQIKSLQSMPVDTSFTLTPQADEHSVVGPLGRLNRQQLLQVMVNSPAAQTVLYSQGCCVFSLEQLIVSNKMAQMKSPLNLKRFMFDSY
ncbi:transcription factor bHLH117 [Tripterygium wilfordii]|uniref:transcription factor bHLH117 n=1 Tax=Tripterygium wilfordii TaxID=458696 RepID=UPI0018F857FA|nr:transcription factor bHLH117 [Tripterygium wilfordii]